MSSDSTDTNLLPSGYRSPKNDYLDLTHHFPPNSVSISGSYLDRDGYDTPATTTTITRTMCNDRKSTSKGLQERWSDYISDFSKRSVPPNNILNVSLTHFDAATRLYSICLLRAAYFRSRETPLGKCGLSNRYKNRHASSASYNLTHNKYQRHPLK